MSHNPCFFLHLAWIVFIVKKGTGNKKSPSQIDDKNILVKILMLGILWKTIQPPIHCIDRGNLILTLS